jgi:hypothetical protein
MRNRFAHLILLLVVFGFFKVNAQNESLTLTLKENKEEFFHFFDLGDNGSLLITDGGASYYAYAIDKMNKVMWRQSFDPAKMFVYDMKHLDGSSAYKTDKGYLVFNHGGGQAMAFYDNGDAPKSVKLKYEQQFSAVAQVNANRIAFISALKDFGKKNAVYINIFDSDLQLISAEKAQLPLSKGLWTFIGVDDNLFFYDEDEGSYTDVNVYVAQVKPSGELVSCDTIQVKGNEGRYLCQNTRVTSVNYSRYRRVGVGLDHFNHQLLLYGPYQPVIKRVQQSVGIFIEVYNYDFGKQLSREFEYLELQKMMTEKNEVLSDWEIEVLNSDFFSIQCSVEKFIFSTDKVDYQYALNQPGNLQYPTNANMSPHIKDLMLLTRMNTNVNPKLAKLPFYQPAVNAGKKYKYIDRVYILVCPDMDGWRIMEYDVTGSVFKMQRVSRGSK